MNLLEIFIPLARAVLNRKASNVIHKVLLDEFGGDRHHVRDHLAQALDAVVSRKKTPSEVAAKLAQAFAPERFLAAYAKIREICADGKVDPDELDELEDIFEKGDELPAPPAPRAARPRPAKPAKPSKAGA